MAPEYQALIDGSDWERACTAVYDFNSVIFMVGMVAAMVSLKSEVSQPLSTSPEHSLGTACSHVLNFASQHSALVRTNDRELVCVTFTDPTVMT